MIISITLEMSRSAPGARPWCSEWRYKCRIISTGHFDSAAVLCAAGMHSAQYLIVGMQCTRPPLCAVRPCRQAPVHSAPRLLHIAPVHVYIRFSLPVFALHLLKRSHSGKLLVFFAPRRYTYPRNVISHILVCCFLV